MPFGFVYGLCKMSCMKLKTHTIVLYISVRHAALKFQGVTSISSQAGYGMVIMVVKEYLHSPECWFILPRKICPTIRTHAISFTLSAGRRSGAGVDTVTEYEVRPDRNQIQMKIYLEKRNLS